MEGSTIWSRPVPLGGNAFTEALVKSFKLSHAKAENLKRTAATTKYARQIFQAMRPVFADLISEIQRSIGFYTATHRDSEIARIMGVGNAFKLPGLQKFMQQNLQIEVTDSRISARGPHDGFKEPTIRGSRAEPGGGVRLALQGLGMASVSSSLLPPEITKQIVWRKKRPLFAAAAACLAGAAGIIWFSNHQATAALSDFVVPSAPPATPEAAEQQLLRASPGAMSPGQYGKSVKLAAERCCRNSKNTKRRLQRPKNLALINSLSEFCPIVPRVIQAIHQGFARQRVGVPAGTGEEYLARIEEAKRKREELLNNGTPPTAPQMVVLDKIVDRTKRQEIWIQKLSMSFNDNLANSQEIGAMVNLTAPEREGLSGKPGWLIRIVGRTTDPSPADGSSTT